MEIARRIGLSCLVSTSLTDARALLDRQDFNSCFAPMSFRI